MRLNSKSFVAKHKKVVASGTPLRVCGHLIASTIAFNEVGATGDTITDSSNNFLLAGFSAGDTITVSGSTSNDGTYTIKTVVAGTITVADTDDLVNELASATVTITTVDADGNAFGTKSANGAPVVIKAFDTNTGIITVGSSSANALNTSVNNYRLQPLENIELQVGNIADIWIDATVSGDKVMVIYEI